MAHSDKDGDSFDCPLDASGHQFKVLLVEDDLFTLKCTSKLLQQCGYEVVNATNGKEALALLNSREDIDMVLTDVLMPEVSGLQLMDELRNARWRDIPVVAMSAESKQEVVLEALKGGAQDYLVKPVRRNELMTLWQHIWRRHQIQASRAKDAAAAGAGTANGTSNSRDSSSSPGPHSASPSKARLTTRRASSLPASLIDAAADAALAEEPSAAVQQSNELILPGAHGLIPAASIPAVLAHPQIDLSIKPLDLSTQGIPQLPHPAGASSSWNKWSDMQMRWMESQQGTGQGFPDCLRELAMLGNQMEARRLHEAAERSGNLAGPSADGLFHDEQSAFNTFTAFVPRPCPRGDASLDDSTSQAPAHKRKRGGPSSHDWAWQQSANGSSMVGNPAYLGAAAFGRVGSMPLPEPELLQQHWQGRYAQSQRQLPEQPAQNSARMPSQAVASPRQQPQEPQMTAQMHQQDLEVQHQHFCSAFQAAVNRHHEMLAADGMPLDTTANRQAALAKFRAKRKARSFEKKVRYESRRRLAETRPRVRGQFVKGNAAADQSTTDLHEQEAHGGQVTAADSADLPVAA
ncbi:hypothetical protein WJX74_009296 [Apatococcus lobatus]|uniref:Uncharacterized protein n=1 Tax=Apatococcus lobatus TaxID=904363 RepID=A0AAW1S5U8_9CHLO